MGLKESTYSSFTCAVKALLTKYCHQKVVGQQPSSLKILKCQKGPHIAPLKRKLYSSLYQCNTWKHTTLLPPSPPTSHPPRYVLQAAKRRSSVICQPNVKVSKDSWWTRLGFFVKRKVVGEVGKGVMANKCPYYRLQIKYSREWMWDMMYFGPIEITMSWVVCILSCATSKTNVPDSDWVKFEPNDLVLSMFLQYSHVQGSCDVHPVPSYQPSYTSSSCAVYMGKS